MSEYYIGQKFSEMYPPEAAEWCNENNAYIKELDPVDDVRQFEIFENEPYMPTYEEQRQKRAEAYRLEKDPITCQIQSLRDEEQTPEIEQEIADLIQEREQVVEDIQARYPYPVE